MFDKWETQSEQISVDSEKLLKKFKELKAESYEQGRKDQRFDIAQKIIEHMDSLDLPVGDRYLSGLLQVMAFMYGEEQ